MVSIELTVHIHWRAWFWICVNVFQIMILYVCDVGQEINTHMYRDLLVSIIDLPLYTLIILPALRMIFTLLSQELRVERV